MADPGASGNGIERQLGILIGRVDALVERSADADEGRRRMHERIDGLGREIVEMRVEVRGDLRDLGGRMEAVEVVTQEGKAAIQRFQKYEAGGKAAVSFITIMGRPLGTILKVIVLAAVGLLLAGWREILAALTGGGTPPP